jgi:nicotinamide riboside transporter PnuC
MWSYVLAVIGVAGIYFVGRKTIWGWLVLLFNETLWITYALITKQYGFILSALAYAVVYIRSFMHWNREDKQEPEYSTINTHGDIDHRFIKID